MTVPKELLTLLDPGEVVVLPRAAIRELLTEAVARGELTRAAADRLATALEGAGRGEAEHVLEALEPLVAAGIPEHVPTTIGPALPIPGYDDLTAAEVASRLVSLAPAELRRLRDYERRNANRKSVLAALGARLGD